MSRSWGVLVTLLCACSGDAGLANYYPALPPTGGPQQVFAGEVTDASQLLTGPAQSGLVGDFLINPTPPSDLERAATDECERADG